MIRFKCVVSFLLSLLLVGSAYSQQTNDSVPLYNWVLEQLNHDDPYVVTETLKDLAIARDEFSQLFLPQFMELANSELSEQRLAAIHCLEELGPRAQNASAVLEQRLTDPELHVRIATADALWKIDQRADLAVPVLMDALAGDDEWASDRAKYHLYVIGPNAAEALEQLVELIGHPLSHVRANAIGVLGALGPKYRSSSEGPLQAALGDTDSHVRIQSAIAIDQIDGSLETAIEVLASIVAEHPSSDPDSHLQIGDVDGSATQAAEALGWIGADASMATRVLADALSSSTLSIRLAAATALGEIGTGASEAIPALAQALQETEAHSRPFAHRVWRVSDNAAIALEMIGVDSVPLLIDALDSEDPIVRVNAVRALGGIHEAAPQTIDSIASLFQDENPLVRIEAAKAAGNLGDAASTIAPELAHLLLDDSAFTSFRGGTGIGHAESVRAESCEALLKINPRVDDIIPVFVRSLEQAADVPYETIIALRAFEGSFSATREPLMRRLSNESTRVGAASALAFIDPKAPGLKEILSAALIEDDSVNSIAAIGLGRLAESGIEIEADFRQTWLDQSIEQRNLISLSNLLRVDPTNRHVVEALLEKLRYAHYMFDETGIHETELTLTELASHRTVREAMIAEMAWRADPLTDTNEDNLISRNFGRFRHQDEVRVRMAKILVVAGVEMDSVMNCLSQLVSADNVSVQGEVADILAMCQSEREAAIALLSQLIELDDRYGVGGDFYGNGAEMRRVGDRAAAGLAALRARTTLQSHLHHPKESVRLRTISAIAELGRDALSDELLEVASDSSGFVRRQTLKTLGRIGDSDESARILIQPVLENSLRNDRRPSVRNEAAEILIRWQ